MNLKQFIQHHAEKQKMLIKKVIQNEKAIVRKIGIKLKEKVYKLEDEFLTELTDDSDNQEEEVIFKKDIIKTHDNKNV